MAKLKTRQPLYPQPLEQRLLFSLSPISFGPVSALPFANAQSSLAVADLNGDGHPDIIVGSRSYNTVSILFGAGNAAFNSPVSYAVGANPDAIAVRDVNGDGRPDIVTANISDNTVSVLLNKKNHTFTHEVTYAVGSQPTDVELADLNGDGKLDIVVVNSGDSTFGVLLGNGNGTFASMVTYASGSGSNSAAIADFNNDGKLDVAVCNGVRGGQVWISNGLGNGTFGTPVTFSGGAYGEVSLRTADFNGDGKPDLAVVDVSGSNYGPYPDGVTDLINTTTPGGTETFTATGVTTGYLPDSVAIADFNGDGKPDEAVANSNGLSVGRTPSPVTVIGGNGDGTFIASTQVEAKRAPSLIAAADVNGDGKPDLIMLDPNNQTIDIALNSSAGIASLILNGDTLVATGSTGNDVAGVTDDGTSITFNFNGQSETFLNSAVHLIDVSLGAGDDSISVGAGVPSLLIGGGSGADTIVAGNSASDTLRGGAGADSISAGITPGIAKGGKGHDTLSGGGAGSHLAGGSGRDLINSADLSSSGQTVHGGAGDDTVAAGLGADMLTGGRGNDLFINGSGTGETVDGGTGLNFAENNSGDALANIYEIYDPSAPMTPGIRAAFSQAAPASVSVAVVDTVDKITGTDGPDKLTVSADGMGNLVVKDAGTIIQILPISSVTGIAMLGFGGDDTLRVSPDITLPVTIRGGAGNDSLVGGGGNNVLVGNAGDDTLVGGPAGTSLLVGGSRSAFSNAPSGNDSLEGGGGAAIADFSRRTDPLVLSNNGQPTSGDTAAGETTTIATNVSVIWGGTGNDSITATTPGMFLSGGDGLDTIVASGVATIEIGGNGSDSVVAASAGSDALYLRDGSPDTYSNTTVADILQLDTTGDVSG